MENFTPETVYNALGPAEPCSKKILHIAANMLRDDKDHGTYKDNINTLIFYIGMVEMAYNTGKFCNCFK